MREFTVESERLAEPSRSGREFLALQSEDVVPITWQDSYDGAAPATRETLDARIDELRTDLVELSHQLFHNPELGFKEYESVAAVADLLRRHGYEPTVGVHGLETALRCEAGDEDADGPTIAIMAEYDALPGIGHACGHNVICASGVGAFLVAAPAVAKAGARLVLLGTPAEENGTGKEIMVQHGALEGIDAAMMVHPYAGVSRTSTTDYLGLRELYVTFTGQSTHASASPFMGLNALDAAVQVYNGVSMLRQQLLFTDRIHAVILEGGSAPNVIPERTKMHLYVRSATTTGLTELSDRVEAVIVAAAHATGCEATVRWDDTPPCLPVRSNDIMAERFALHYSAAGQEIMGPQTIVSGAGSTDMGNVSVRVPSIHPMVAIAPGGVSLHTAHFADFAAEERADEVLAASARALAGTAADLVEDADLLAAVRQEFEDAGGVPTEDLEALL
ncbi:MAG: M20 family metallopeptidase [Bowdeniella nasicola]|nr:M20 family metallopeptidase [Bowdeniella nasicola]